MPRRCRNARCATRLFETRYGIQARKHCRSRADRSENNVLLAFLMACWRWLTSPPPAAALAPGYPLQRPVLAALLAVRPRFILLAPIHVPWPPRLSPRLA